MGPRRTTTRGRNRGRPARRLARGTAPEHDDVPDIYQDMLAEAARNPLPKTDLRTKGIKRRKLLDGSPQVTDSELATRDLANSPIHDLEIGDDSETARPLENKQIVFDDFNVSDDDSEDAFEDVDLQANLDLIDTHDRAEEPLQIDLNKKLGPDITPSARRRKPANAFERKIRLDVHKWHVLCLLAHVQRRNHWCDDVQVQSILKPLVPRKFVRLLHLDFSQPQYQRTHSFNTAIEEVSKIWRSEWKITEHGMRRAFWKEDPDNLRNVDDYPDPIDYDDFRDAARTVSGSRDLGAQLFCALLRAIAVDTRLVCSLQPLPFSGVAKGTTMEEPKPKYIMASTIDRQPKLDQIGENHSPSDPRWRLYNTEPERSKTPPVKKASKRIRDSPYPIFWVEVFNEALQKWIPVDPLVRNTINKPKTGFEPPANDLLNNMSYVIAFEDDGSAKDVTRRYAQFYNGKTRRSRVESTKGGDNWWRKTMSFFEQPFPDDRGDIEDAELLAREESEQMPKNVQDFKNHPQYALERHLKRNEVIHPKREIGKVSVGLSKDGKLEPVFRRRDVLVVKTGDQWYRLGRDVKIGEQPLKRVVSTKRRVTPTEDEPEQEDGALLYAEFQTELYVPPMVLNSKVPRNAYGNLDVFVPSMIPAGGIHVQHPDAAKAARIIGIDYADAVTGFEFKGRQGTAVKNGIVAAAGYEDAFVEVLHGLTDERARIINEKRSSLALQMWKRFLTALRIRERVNAKYKEGGSQAGDDDDDFEDETYQNEDDADEEEAVGGGFFPEQAQQGTATRPLSREIEKSLDGQDVHDINSMDEVEIPIIIHKSPHKLPHEEQQPSSTVAAERAQQDSTAIAGGFLLDHAAPVNEDTCGRGQGGGASEGGGFIVEDQPVASPEAPSPPPSNSHGFPTSFTAFPPNDENLDPDPPTTKKQQQQDLSDTSRPFKPPEESHLPPKSSTAAAAAAAVTDPPSTLPYPPQPPPPQTKTTTTTTTTTSQRRDESDNDSTSLTQSSLLSQDPEDEDAEPDWLAEAMDSE